MPRLVLVLEVHLTCFLYLRNIGSQAANFTVPSDKVLWEREEYNMGTIFKRLLLRSIYDGFTL